MVQLKIVGQPLTDFPCYIHYQVEIDEVIITTPKRLKMVKIYPGNFDEALRPEYNWESDQEEKKKLKWKKMQICYQVKRHAMVVYFVNLWYIGRFI